MSDLKYYKAIIQDTSGADYEVYLPDAPIEAMSVGGSIDLTEYVRRTADDRATGSQLGLVRADASYGITTSTAGTMMASTRTAEQAATNSGTLLMGLGTLRNMTVDFECIGKDGVTTHYYLPSIPPKA